jgi:hypothetical protein
MPNSPYLDGADQAAIVRVGVLLADTPQLCADAAGLVADLLTATFVRPVFFRVRSNRTDSRVDAPSWVLSLYDRWDRTYVSPACERERAARHAADQVGVVTEQELAQRLASENLDVLLLLQPFSGAGSFARFARYGLWWTGSCPSFGSNEDYLQRFLCTARADAPMIEAVWGLEDLDAPPFPLEWASSRLISSISVSKNLEPLRPVRHNLWLAALRTLAVRGWQALRNKGLDAPIVRSLPEASTVSIVGSLMKMGSRQANKRWRRRSWTYEWQLGVRPLRQNGAALCESSGYQWLTTDNERWYADPFLVSWKGREFLFAEEYDKARGIGRIACGEIAADGQVQELRPALARPYHLSYPHVFEHGGEMFMIPESGVNGTVELYRAVAFPFTWELVRVLYRGPAFDTTVLFEQGRFWFFTSLVQDSDHEASQLLLFSSAAIDGDWKLHPASPVTNDARFSRNAGGFLRMGATLLRPTQDGSRIYGERVNFRQVTRLSESEYEEADFDTLAPPTDGVAIGMHTYSRSSRLEAVDRLVVRTDESVAYRRSRRRS